MKEQESLEKIITKYAHQFPGAVIKIVSDLEIKNLKEKVDKKKNKQLSFFQ